MQSRRKFLKNAAAGSLAIPLASNILANTQQQKSGAPLVVSTWNFGKEANRPAWEIIKKNGTALDAVEAGVQIPEADPRNQSVGYGGLPDRDGRVTLDACIMDHLGNCGSVAALEHIVHPISVARMVMEKTPHIMLVGDGALQFALANGFKKEKLLTPEAEAAWKNWLKTSEYKPVMNIENQRLGDINNHDTIGMIALDNHGNVSGACTTSGMAWKLHGRVGDSPIIGAGLFVDNEAGAATATGVGEEVIRIVGGHLVVELLRQGYSPEKACRKAVERIIKKDPVRLKDKQVGFIAINKKGQYGGYALHKGFQYAVTNANGEQVLDCDYHFK